MADIKHILENPNLDKKQVLKTQKALLEKKRNRLDGIIQLITDVMEGVNTMTFDAFSNDDIQKIINHTIECMSKDALEKHIKQYGSLEKYCEHLSKGFQNEQAMSDVIRWYGSKDKAVDAILQSTGNEEELNQQQNKNDEVYRLLIEAKEKRNIELEKEGIAKLAEVYKEMFKVDNARAILLDLGKEYLQNDMLAKAIDDQYGNGSAKFIAEAILRYYGE
ncbi:MAG: MerR family transcriptional regulator [Clostridiales bacterium]|nr:MerR family transcriptional regulator [Clostridiales bacterium]